MFSLPPHRSSLGGHRRKGHREVGMKHRAPPSYLLLRTPDRSRRVYVMIGNFHAAPLTATRQRRGWTMVLEFFFPGSNGHFGTPAPTIYERVSRWLPKVMSSSQMGFLRPKLFFSEQFGGERNHTTIYLFETASGLAFLSMGIYADIR